MVSFRVGVRTWWLSCWVTVNGMPLPMGKVDEGEFASSRANANANGLLSRDG